MRKIGIAVLIFLTTIVLASCTTKFYATATVDQIEKTVSEIKTVIDIKDPDSQVESKIFFYLYTTDSEEKRIDSKDRTLKQLKDADNIITFFNLTENTVYRLVIETTWSGKSRNLFNGNISTVIKDTMDINSEEDFMKIAAIERENKTRTVYTLTRDLDFAELTDELNKNLIGTFRGEFLGSGFTIKNYHVNSSTNSSMGLFAQVSSNAVIKDLKIDNYTFTKNHRTITRKVDVDGTLVDTEFVTRTSTSSYIGVLFGQNSSSTAEIKNIEITNSKLNLNINTESTYTNFGILGGTVSGTVENIVVDNTNELNINLMEHSKANIGGLIGELKSTAVVKELYSAVKVTVNVEQERIVLPTTEEKDPESDKEDWELDELAGGGLVGRLIINLNIGGVVGLVEEAKISDVVSNSNILVEKLDYAVYNQSREGEKEKNKAKNINVNVGGLYGRNNSKVLTNHLFGGNIDIPATFILSDDLNAAKPHVYRRNLHVGGLIGSAVGFTELSVTNFARTDGSVKVALQTGLANLRIHSIYGETGTIDYANTQTLGVFGTLNDLYDNSATGFDQTGLFQIIDLTDFFKDSQWVLDQIL